MLSMISYAEENGIKKGEKIVHDTLHLQMPSQHLHNAYSLKEYS